MPEKGYFSAFEKCNFCATVNGPGLGPLPTVTHPEVCCLFRVTAPFLNKGSSPSHDGRCDACPSRIRFQREALQVGPVYQPSQRISDAPQEGIAAFTTGCEMAPVRAESRSKRRKTIEERTRTGHKKLILEIRPRKFKKKLWFGTYTEKDIARAKDAVNYYMGYNQPYNHPDSPEIFAEKPLRIKFEELLPSCDQVIQLGDQKELAYIYFARQVKEVIRSVIGKPKKSAKQRYKCKMSQQPQPPAPEEDPQGQYTYDPVMPSAPGSATSSDEQSVACPSPKADSEFAASYPMFLPLDRTLTHDEYSRYFARAYSDDLLTTQYGEGVLPLDEIFTNYFGESSIMEENTYLTESSLWVFLNEDPSLPFE